MKLCLYGTAEWDRIYGIPITRNTAVLCRHVTGERGTLTCLDVPESGQADWNRAHSFAYHTIGTQGDIRIVRISDGRVINGAAADNAFPPEWMIPIAKAIIGPATAYLRGSRVNQVFEVSNEMGLCRGLTAKSGDSGSLAWNGRNEVLGFVSTALSIAPIPAQFRPTQHQEAAKPTPTPIYSPETLPTGVISIASPTEKAKLTLEEDLIQSTRAVLRRHGLL